MVRMVVRELNGEGCCFCFVDVNKLAALSLYWKLINTEGFRTQKAT